METDSVKTMNATFDQILCEPRTIDLTMQTELDAKLTHSYEQSIAQCGYPYEAVFHEAEKGLR